MDFELKYLLAPLGIGFLVLLSWLLGAFRQARLTSADAARQRFAADFPALRVQEVVLDQNGTCALLALEGGLAGLVFAVGDKFATRLFKPGAGWPFTTEALVMQLVPDHDSVAPVRFRFSDEATAATWDARLERLQPAAQEQAA